MQKKKKSPRANALKVSRELDCIIDHCSSRVALTHLSVSPAYIFAHTAATKKSSRPGSLVLGSYGVLLWTVTMTMHRERVGIVQGGRNVSKNTRKSPAVSVRLVHTAHDWWYSMCLYWVILFLFFLSTTGWKCEMALKYSWYDNWTEHYLFLCECSEHPENILGTS